LSKLLTKALKNSVEGKAAFDITRKTPFLFEIPPGHLQLRLTRKATSLSLVNFHDHKKTHEPALIKATKNH
jgi:hypothetical protein